MDKSDLSFRIGHRERLRQKFLDGNLADYELLELLLSFAIPRRDVRPLARGLMAKFGGIHQVLTAPIENLMKYDGVGKNTAVFIKAIQKIILLDYKSGLKSGPVFRDEKVLANYCKMLLSGKSTEEMHILYLGPEMSLIQDDLHSAGTANWSAVYPREIMKRALDLNARSVVMLHNHPTPHMSFSQDDIEITTEIRDMLAMVDIELHDHYVVSGDIIYSARNLFLLN